MQCLIEIRHVMQRPNQQKQWAWLTALFYVWIWCKEALEFTACSTEDENSQHSFKVDTVLPSDSK